MSRKNIHVVPTHDGWLVESEDGSSSQHRFTSLDHAISAGREKARREKVELLIHGRDRQLLERNSFSNEPRDVQT